MPKTGYDPRHLNFLVNGEVYFNQRVSSARFTYEHGTRGCDDPMSYVKVITEDALFLMVGVDPETNEICFEVGLQHDVFEKKEWPVRIQLLDDGNTTVRLDVGNKIPIDIIVWLSDEPAVHDYSYWLPRKDLRRLQKMVAMMDDKLTEVGELTSDPINALPKRYL